MVTWERESRTERERLNGRRVRVRERIVGLLLLLRNSFVTHARAPARTHTLTQTIAPTSLRLRRRSDTPTRNYNIRPQSTWPLCTDVGELHGPDNDDQNYHRGLTFYRHAVRAPKLLTAATRTSDRRPSPQLYLHHVLGVL